MHHLGFLLFFPWKWNESSLFSEMMGSTVYLLHNSVLFSDSSKGLLLLVAILASVQGFSGTIVFLGELLVIVAIVLFLQNLQCNMIFINVTFFFFLQ